MGTNRPNPQQHNQQKQQPVSTQQQPDEDQLRKEEQARVAAALRLAEEQEVAKIKEAAAIVKEAEPHTFKELLATLFQKVLLGQLDPQQARLSMHVWYRNLTPDQKELFKQNRDQNDLDINRLKGIIDTLAQEVPYMYTY